jgi:crossover junction endonuclease MUS81
MKKHEEKLATGYEAVKLEGIGKHTAEKLHKRLQKHYQDMGITPPDVLLNAIAVATESVSRKRQSAGTSEELTANPPGAAKKTVKRPYVPVFQSGPYAILLALYMLPDEPITKSRLISVAQDFCSSSFTQAEGNKSYTAWSSMKTLVTKELVLEQGNPKRYILSEEGRELAAKLQRASSSVPNSESQELDASLPSQSQEQSQRVVRADSCQFTQETLILDSDDEYDGESASVTPTAQATPTRNSNSLTAKYLTLTSLLAFEPLVFRPGEFEICLILDNRERAGQSDRTYLQREMDKRGVMYETRTLDLGDFTWIAKRKPSATPHSGTWHVSSRVLAI